MSILEFLNNSKDAVLSKTIDQIVKICGNGNLTDGSSTSTELNNFLSEVEPEQLANYAKYCLENKFDSSGFVLQDVINEIGRRIDFKVKNGLYQGKKNAIGFDGIWTSKNEDFVIEIKTTDAYLIDLDTPNKYRDQLINSGAIRPNTNCLIVVGRNEKASKAFELQLRGSRHAWSMRIISVDALIKLMHVNCTTSTETVTEKIHTILRPLEYIKVDQIVDVLFSATEDKDVEISLSENSTEKNQRQPNLSSSSNDINVKRLTGIDRLSKKLGTNLIKRRRTNFSDNNNEILATIAISKNYETNGKSGYWYGYHSRQARYLSEAISCGYMIYGMLDRAEFYAIPYSDIEKFKTKFDITVSEKKESYWHIRIVNRDLDLVLKLNDSSEIPLIKYKI